SGLLSEKGLRSPAFRLLRYGVRADARLEADHLLACRAAALVLSPGAILAGRSAAYLLGVESAASFADPVEVIAPPSAPWGRVGMTVHETEVRAADVTSIGWCVRTSPARTAWDVAVWHDILVAVPILDSMVREGIVTADALSAATQRLAGGRGGRRAA